MASIEYDEKTALIKLYNLFECNFIYWL